MKTYQSTTEGTWIEVLPVQLSEEQIQLMMSKDDADKEAQAQLAADIKSQRENEVSEEKSSELASFYSTVKPSIKEGDVYKLISIDLTETDANKTGILNYRINGEHKQIRF